MKTSVKVIAFMIITATMFACASSETEVLKHARTIQDGIKTSSHNLDSTIDLTIEQWNAKLTAMSNDSIAMKDSANIAEFNSLSGRVSELTNYKSKLSDWLTSMKMLPSTEDIKNGVENPFGGDAKDQDILSEIKKSQEEFNDLKSEIETAMQ